MDSSSTSNFSPGASLLKRNSNDVRWEYGILYDSKNPDRVKCKLCGKEMGGGVYKIKEHIAHRKGNVSSCPRSTKEDQFKCMKAILEAKNKKRKMKREADMFSLEVYEQNREDDSDEDPMDKFVMAVTTEDSLGGETGQENTNDVVSEERMSSVHQSCGRWIYQSGIPFNVIESDSFRSFCEALGRFGPGWVPPNQCELRETLLEEEEEIIKEKLKSLEVEQEQNGCSILIDVWSDTKKNIMNLCVNSRGGTCFVSSKEVSKEPQTGKFIFEYVDKCIEDVGAEKVVQVITDSAENNLAAAKMLKEKRPGIFWSSCAADTVKLMLEDIVKLPKISKYIEKAKAVTMFIYGHEKTLAMMRCHTKERDIVRAGVTRFATTFLTLQRLLARKEQLRFMFVSDEWDKCKDSNYVKGRSAYYTCPAFWDGVKRVVKVLEPLVKVLRMVDGEKKPSMGFIYGELVEAKRSIKAATKNLERYYQPILDIIDEKIKGRLDSPLHLTAYLLNPFYFYNEPTIQLDGTLMTGFLNCVETFYHGELEKQDKAVDEFRIYQDKDVFFGTPYALRGCEQNTDEFGPEHWWSTYGVSVPSLETLAMKILSLTSSSSGCQRNWSTFEEIHKSERNRLDTDQMNSVVYVQFNSKLFNKRKRIKEENADVLVDGAEENIEDWFVELDRDGEEDKLIDEDGDDNPFHIEFESEDEQV
ncbi:unnamed protein product [Arabidopsis lyrata]|uniref:uncharacterized protein LOC9329838 n=1 Tax=Arabidopsis lyrata subsp. lyrata TaxID=81972 RepID=UPI000A29E15B|nr:uncharacterized protein LOC9329838 [Arabidopsis lyrata subsp. lyrata]CAH8254209.1 unnamed protein product [Arabidopsis lyrata]|eukprot:XP_020866080.1 uncharacterized protein LOC9329838 [Arabidopsis lyrata subsp. lyrata]